MIALREGSTKLSHEHFLSGIAEGTSILVQPFVYAHASPLSSTKQEEERPHVFRLDWYGFSVYYVFVFRFRYDSSHLESEWSWAQWM